MMNRREIDSMMRSCMGSSRAVFVRGPKLNGPFVVSRVWEQRGRVCMHLFGSGYYRLEPGETVYIDRHDWQDGYEYVLDTKADCCDTGIPLAKIMAWRS